MTQKVTDGASNALALRWPERALLAIVLLLALVYLLRAPIWNDFTAGASLGERDGRLMVGAPSFDCKGDAAMTQCEMSLGDETLRIDFPTGPTLACVASYAEQPVACIASYRYAPQTKPFATLPSLRGVAPPLWSASGLLVRLDSVLAFRMDLFVWFLSLTTTLLVGLSVARRSRGSKLRRYASTALLSVLTWALIMGVLLVSVFLLGYDD